MAVYSNATATFIDGTEPDVMEVLVANAIKALDSGTYPDVTVVPYRDGLLVVAWGA